MLTSEGLSAETFRARMAILDARLTDASGVLHLGAHLGQEADFYAARNLAVVWVEALPAIHARLQDHIAKFPNQRAFCAVLGDEAGRKVNFNVSNNWEGVSSSLFEFGPLAQGPRSLWPEADLHMVERLTLEMTTLDALLDDASVDAAHFDHWVLDLQGAERLALAGAKRSLPEARTLLVEVSLEPVYEGGALYPDLELFLAGAGLKPLWAPEKAHDEVLFVRA